MIYIYILYVYLFDSDIDIFETGERKSAGRSEQASKTTGVTLIKSQTARNEELGWSWVAKRLADLKDL